jgi:hypothetical protein
VSSPPRNAASPGPGEAERQPRGACRGRDRQIRARQPACPRPTGTTLGDGLSGTRHHAQCPGMWRDVRSPSRTVLSSSLATSSQAQRYGPACRAPAHRMPRYERPRTQ